MRVADGLAQVKMQMKRADTARNLSDEAPRLVSCRGSARLRPRFSGCVDAARRQALGVLRRRALRRLGFRQWALVEFSGLQDVAELALVLQDSDVAQRIAIDDKKIGDIARL